MVHETEERTAARCPAVVRQARRHDLPKLVDLWTEMMHMHIALDPRFQLAPDAQEQCRRHMKRAIHDRRMCVYVAEIAEQVVGYVLASEAVRPPVYPAGRYGFISDLFVLEPYRRQGIGSMLVRRALLWLRSIGVTSVELLASEYNEHAQRFWEAMGFARFLRMYRLDILP